MNIVVCLDDNDGMQFNGRRQSRDAMVIGDIMGSLNGLPLYAFSSSKPLFSGYEDDVMFITCLPSTEKGYLFLESNAFLPDMDKVESIVIYRWNKVYPSDMRFCLKYKDWLLESSYDFVGKSHDRITKEVYVRR